MFKVKERVIDGGKLDISHKCPGCGKLCLGQLWHSHGRSFEDLACDNCGLAWGRVDGHVWHPMGVLRRTSYPYSKANVGVKEYS